MNISEIVSTFDIEMDMKNNCKYASVKEDMLAYIKSDCRNFYRLRDRIYDYGSQVTSMEIEKRHMFLIMVSLLDEISQEVIFYA